MKHQGNFSKTMKKSLVAACKADMQTKFSTPMDDKTLNATCNCVFDFFQNDPRSSQYSKDDWSLILDEIKNHHTLTSQDVPDTKKRNDIVVMAANYYFVESQPEKR